MTARRQDESEPSPSLPGLTRGLPPAPGSPDSASEVTLLLEALCEDNQESAKAIFPIVYRELRKLARAFLRNERDNHTLQTTALVHEVYLKLVDQRMPWKSQGHFFAIAAKAMRRILVDHARKRATSRRGGDIQKVPLEDDLVSISPHQSTMLLSLDEALTRLEAISARQSQVIELRFFAGMSEHETAAVLEVSSKTVKRDWRKARAWLNREIGGSDE